VTNGGDKKLIRQADRIQSVMLTFLTNPGVGLMQPIKISRAAATDSVDDAGQCRVTSTATGGTSARNK